MKARWFIPVLAVAAVGMSACTDFLEEKITTANDENIIFSTEAGVEANLMGCYSQFAASGFKNTYFNEFLQPGSGLLHWGLPSGITNALERWSCALKFTRFSKQPESYNSMKALYQCVYRCNALLYNLKDSPLDPAFKEEIEGEALFLRAMSYFWLVRLYGDVSLHTTPPISIDAVYKPRENFWTVYGSIVADLDAAEAKMWPFEKMSASTGNQTGRVCDYAATAMRSLVYLTIGTLLAHPDDNFWLPEERTPDFSSIGISDAEDAFRKALADAEKVIQDGPFELAPSFADLFRWTEPGDWQLKERIFVLPTTPEGGGGDLAQYTLPRYYKTAAMVSNNVAGRIRPSRWLFQKWCETYGGRPGTGAHQQGMYVGCPDPRFDLTLVHTAYTGTASSATALTTVYPTDSKVYQTSAINYYLVGAPFYKKYYDPTYKVTTGKADLYVMRFAEVYLIAAEACANLCSDPSDAYGTKAVGYVNVLLERARKSTEDGSEAAQPAAWASSDARLSTKEGLVDAIFWERAFELSGEQHEWFDTHRMGARWIVDHIAKPKNAFLSLPQQADELLMATYYGAGFRYDEDWMQVRKGLISAYPNDELVYNTALDINQSDPNYGQNPAAVFWR